MTGLVNFLDTLTGLVSKANGFIWGPYFLITLLCGTGIYYTIRLKGVQFRLFGAGWKQLFGNFSLHGKAAGKDGMSSFQAVSTAIAAQVGTGNLVGAMTAFIKGGPGAIFWMWLAAIAGMATIFGEATLAQIFKTKDETGQTVGGPAYYISQGLGNTGFAKFLAGFFAVSIILALGFMGNMVQANSISDAFQNAFKIPTFVTGIILAIIAGIIFIGGVKRIASVTEKVVPIMAIAYILVGTIIVLINIKHIPAMFSTIFKAAFNPDAIWGGALGFGISKAARYGIARGLFSNEAGMGSTPHAHAVAQVEHPVKQGSVAIVSVFIDTFVVLTITVFVVLSQNLEAMPSLQGIELVQAAFSSALMGKTGIGYTFIAVCLLFFAFSTIIGWYYFAETNIRYLFGAKGLLPYQVLVILFVFIGSLLKIDLVWELVDFFNGIMVVPNLIALLLLSGITAKLLKDYKKNVPFDVSHYKGTN